MNETNRNKSADIENEITTSKFPCNNKMILAFGFNEKVEDYGCGDVLRYI